MTITTRIFLKKKEEFSLMVTSKTFSPSLILLSIKLAVQTNDDKLITLYLRFTIIYYSLLKVKFIWFSAHKNPFLNRYFINSDLFLI